jgi:hypothetical protein
MSTAYGAGGTASETLHEILQSYVAFAFAHHDVVGLLITEIRHLPPEETHDVRRAQHDYLNEWAHLLQLAKPDLTSLEAHVRVNAAVDVVNNLSRIPKFNRNAGVPSAVEELCLDVLGLRPSPAPESGIAGSDT